jgi:CBS domain containing-hemolysin-like protein
VIHDLSIAILLAAGCVLMSAFFSGTEVALFSLRRVDREALTSSNLGRDRLIQRMLERPRRLIATVLIGNQAFDSILAVIVLDIVWQRHWVDSPWAICGVAIAMALPPVVLLAEVTAKTLAAKAPLAWARACAGPLSLFTLLITPVRVVVQFVTSILLRPLGESARTRPARDLSAEEFRTLVDAGSAQGQVDARERRLIHRVFEFNNKNVGQVMTPRDRVFALSYDLPMQRLAKEVAARGFSRVPIYQKSLDNIRGILNAKVLVRTAAGQPAQRSLGETLHEPLFVPRTTPVKRLFLTFKQKKSHMAIVVSEYGKVLGIVTMDDLLAQIFGQLKDERADLQSSIPPGTRMRVRTPPTGTVPRPGSQPGVADAATDDAVPSELTGPVRYDGADASVPVPRLDEHTPPDPLVVNSPPLDEPELASRESVPDSDGELASRESMPDAEGFPESEGSDPGVANAILDPPPPPGLRPIHAADELTPPAQDVEELRSRLGDVKHDIDELKRKREARSKKP